MFDFTLIGPSAAAPVGAARGSQGAAEAPDEASAGAFGDALASLAGLDAEAGEAAAIDAEAAAGADVDRSGEAQTETDADDEAGDEAGLIIVSTLTFDAVQSGVAPDRTAPAPAHAPAGESTEAAAAQQGRPGGLFAATAPASGPAGTTAATGIAPGAFEPVPAGDGASAAAPSPAAESTPVPAPVATAVRAEAVAEDAAAPAGAAASEAADAARAATIDGAPRGAQAHGAAPADARAEAAALAAAQAAADAAARPVAQRRADAPGGRDVAATMVAGAKMAAQPRTVAQVARIVERLKAAVGAAGSHERHAPADALAAQAAETDAAPVITGAPTLSHSSDAATTSHPAAAPGAAMPLADATRPVAHESSDLAQGFGAAPQLMAPRLATVAPAPVSAAFTSLVDGAGAAGTLPAGTTSQIVQAIRMQFAREGGEAHIKLDPRQFGDLSVRIRVDQGQVVASVEADTPVVREWLQSNQHLLRHSLAGQQLTLDRLEVSEPPASTDRDREGEDQARGGQDESRQRRQRRRPETSELFDVVA